MGGNIPIFKSRITDFSLGYIEGILKFSSIFHEISHNDSKDIIRRHNYGYFWVKNVVFNEITFVISYLKTIGLLQKQQY